MSSSPSGFVYLVVNPRFPGWIKVGQTTHPQRRLGDYQTGDPTRSYRMLVAVPTTDRRQAEWLAHVRLRRLGFRAEGEWFQVAPVMAERVVKKAVAQVEDKQSAP